MQRTPPGGGSCGHQTRQIRIVVFGDVAIFDVVVAIIVIVIVVVVTTAVATIDVVVIILLSSSLPPPPSLLLPPLSSLSSPLSLMLSLSSLSSSSLPQRCRHHKADCYVCRCHTYHHRRLPSSPSTGAVAASLSTAIMTSVIAVASAPSSSKSLC